MKKRTDPLSNHVTKALEKATGESIGAIPIVEKTLEALAAAMDQNAAYVAEDGEAEMAAAFRKVANVLRKASVTIAPLR